MPHINSLLMASYFQAYSDLSLFLSTTFKATFNSRFKPAQRTANEANLKSIANNSRILTTKQTLRHPPPTLSTKLVNHCLGHVLFSGLRQHLRQTSPQSIRSNRRWGGEGDVKQNGYDSHNTGKARKFQGLARSAALRLCKNKLGSRTLGLLSDEISENSKTGCQPKRRTSRTNVNGQI